MNGANSKSRIATGRRFYFLFCVLPFAGVAISGCAAFQLGGEIVKGRRELMYGDPKVALPYVQRAAALDPNYVTDFTIFREGVWTYVGRANYASGNLTEARKALEQARSRHADDDMAKIYLGLVLGREGDHQRGLKEIEAGLTGLADWLDFVEFYHPRGYYWDPAKKIRSEARKNVALITGRDVNWQELIANVEWIGKEMELEIDRAWRDEKRDMERDKDSRSTLHYDRKFHG